MAICLPQGDTMLTQVSLTDVSSVGLPVSNTKNTDPLSLSPPHLQINTQQIFTAILAVAVFKKSLKSGKTINN